jgi:uncharacterized protein
MKKIALLLLLLSTMNLSAQAEKKAPTERIIEVTGSAEKLITPNEFTFKITLFERVENREKLTIEKQEERLKTELASIGVDVQKDLTIADISSVFTKLRRKKDVVGSKEYQLKMYDLTKIEKLQQVADKLDLNRLDLVEATHSDLLKFRKETKMEAVKAAKSKAEYMLEAIGEAIGKPIFVQEVVYNGDYNSRSNMILPGSDEFKIDDLLNFSKIKLRFSVLVRFEIK